MYVILNDNWITVIMGWRTEMFLYIHVIFYSYSITPLQNIDQTGICFTSDAVLLRSTAMSTAEFPIPTMTIYVFKPNE